jgi:16S rRNA (adenine1518-N6/adenine1519-N6)-dimethyltransferase
MTQSQIISLLKEYQIKPLESLSQNFFIEKDLLIKIINKINITPDSSLLEIGPGLGSLTELLIQQKVPVIAVELDKTFASILPSVLGNPDNLTVYHQDILKSQELIDTIQTPYTVIANIPYHITGAIIRLLVDRDNPAESINLLIQKEVANNLLSYDKSLFQLSVNIYADVKLLSHIAKECFYPKPKVDSSFIQLTPHNRYAEYNREEIIQLAKLAFQQKRKKISSSLKPKLNQSIGEYSHNIQELLSLRPENLTIDNWIELYQGLK